MGNIVSQFGYPEATSILSKNSKSREEKQMGNIVSQFGYPEATSILFKNSKSREEKQIKTSF